MGFIHLCSALVLAAWTSAAASAADRVHLVHHDPANYPKGYPFIGKTDFPAGRYYALHCAPDCRLDAVALTLKKSMVQTSDGREPGVVATVRDSRRSAFLLRGLAGIKEGPVKTWYINRDFLDGSASVTADEPSGHHERSFDIDGTPLVLTAQYLRIVEKACSGTDCPSTLRVVWRWRFGAVERTIATLNGDAVAGPLGPEGFAVWIGDLDGDGRPDMVARTSDRDDSMDLSLFLSSALVRGKPWRPSAVFSFWDPANPGC
jgi:hypothetical protein